MSAGELPRRQYGRSGIVVSALGLGAGQIGDPALDERVVLDLLDTARAGGVNLIDTAPSYGVSEERLGRLLAHRRGEFVLSTKLGYGVPGIEDWTGPCIAAGIDQALRRLQIEKLDIAHLHSCPLHVLRRDDILQALEAAKAAGKVGAIAYSGENEALEFALACGRFDGVMASLNPFDQRVIDGTLPRLGGMGFFAKRPLANAPWRFAERPHGDYCEAYWLRWRAMVLPDPGMAWGEFASRFAVWQEGVSSAVFGTGSPAHLRELLEWVGRGPLPAELVERWRGAFRERDDGWIGQI